jgi:hypothetical protein
MKFIWEPGATSQLTNYYRCHLAKPMRVPLKDWNGSKHNSMVNQVGYVKATEHGTFHANIFGSISKQMPMSFNTLAEAKRYVEDHATTGLVIKQLHVDV